MIVEPFLSLPLRFFDARARKDLSPGAFEVGCWLACRADYRTWRLEITLEQLLRQLGRTEANRDTLTRQLRELCAGAWIAFEVVAGQRKPWSIEVTGLRPITDRNQKARPADVDVDLRIATAQAAEVTSADDDSGQGASPQEQRVVAQFRPPHVAAAKKDLEQEPPIPPRGGLERKLTGKRHRRFTGCRSIYNGRAAHHVYDPLGTETPPADWPHERPSRQDVLAAFAAHDEGATRLPRAPAVGPALDEPCDVCGERPSRDDGKRTLCDRHRAEAG